MKTLFLISILITVCSTCYASSLQVAQIGDSVQPSLCLEHSMNKTSGVFLFATEASSYNEAYAGLTYAPIPNIQLAFGAGQETGGFRSGGWVWAGKGRISGICLFENGATGPWHKTVAKYAVTSRLSLGYVERSYLGEGIYAEYKVGKSATLKYSGFKTPELALSVSF